MAENTKIIISAVDKTKKGFGSVTSGLKKVTGAVFSMRTALVGVAGVAGFGLLVKSSLSATNSLAKTASKIGTTTEALGALRYAAELTGVSTTTMDMALQRFTRRTAEAAQGMGEAKGAIRELGLNAQELNRMPLDKRMIVLADAFSGVKSESDRLRLAFKLFDSEGAALVNTLSQGGDGLREMLGEARMLGLTMSSSAAKGVEDTVDAFTKLQSLFKGVRDQTVGALAPAIEMLVERFTAFLQRSIEAKGGIERFAKSLAIDLLTGVQIALKAFEDLANGFVVVYNQALRTKDALSNAFTSDGEKNARQLRIEIDKLGKSMAERSQRMEGLTARALRSSELAQKSDLKRLIAFQKLLIVAEDTGESLNLLNKVDFATGLNAQIESMKASLGTVSDAIPKAVLPAIEKISDIKLGFKAFSDSIPNMNTNIQNLTKQGLNGLTDALTAGITGAANFADAMKAMAKSVVDSLIKMLIQKYIVDAAFGFITSKIGGSDSTPVSVSSSLSNLPDARNMFPTYNGGGFTGMGSRSGGVDGKGGFTAILHPNETVIDHTKGQSSGVVVQQTINVTTGVQQTVRAEIVQLMPQIAQAAKGAVADARLRGGNFSKAMGGA
jgi:hypothetical protein